MNRLASVIGAGLVALAAVPAKATILDFNVPMSGAQEVNPQGVPNQGDPDATGLAHLRIDSTTLTVDWNISVQGIDFPLTGAHIHEAPAGSPGPIVVDFQGQLTGRNLQDSDLARVLTNPSNFYVNVHNADFPAGAARGQLSGGAQSGAPEPTASLLLSIGLAALAWLRRA